MLNYSGNNTYLCQSPIPMERQAGLKFFICSWNDNELDPEHGLASPYLAKLQMTFLYLYSVFTTSPPPLLSDGHRGFVISTQIWDLHTDRFLGPPADNAVECTTVQTHKWTVWTLI